MHIITTTRSDPPSRLVITPPHPAPLRSPTPRGTLPNYSCSVQVSQDSCIYIPLYTFRPPIHPPPSRPSSHVPHLSYTSRSRSHFTFHIPPPPTFPCPTLSSLLLMPVVLLAWWLRVIMR
ncbi:hypothetical protein K439DRAFT_844629 [Ramaria rubella]|nr:hypothetical protein K439DRAFT_844629 [Ramaria rubella]